MPINHILMFLNYAMNLFLKGMYLKTVPMSFMHLLHYGECKDIHCHLLFQTRLSEILKKRYRKSISQHNHLIFRLAL